MQENVTGDDWWSDAEEIISPSLASITFLGNGEVLSFLPPPPRPSIFTLEDLGSEAFSATCDLCDWAWKDNAANRSLLLPILPTAALGGELGWVLTLAVVALLSAVIGAAVMVTVLQCRKLKNIGNSGCCSSVSEDDSSCTAPSSPDPLHPHDDTNKTPPLPESRRPRRRGGFWSRVLWGTRAGRASRGPCEISGTQRRAPRRLCPPAPPANENHYTVTEPSLAPSPPITATPQPGEEALYAELHESDSAAYQNTTYLQISEPDLPSAPSSAYYSDLSCGAERMYEAVQGEETPSNWGSPSQLQDIYRTSQPAEHSYNDLVLNTVASRIATITKTVPSDYV